MKFLTSRRFLPLFIVQFIGAFCDNVFKNAFVLLCTFGLAEAHGWNPACAVYLIGGLFILPFLLISGWAGYVSDIWPRHTLVRSLKGGEAFVMLAAAWSLHSDNFYGMWVVIVALGCISALFGPLKYGLLPTYLREDELVGGNAWFEAGSFIAIVTGMLLGVRGAAGLAGRDQVGLVLVLLGLAGAAASWFMPAAPACAAVEFSPWSVRALRRSAADAIHTIREAPVLWRSVLGISWFWALGGVLLSFLPSYVKDVLHQDAGGVTRYLLGFAIGVGVGSFLGLLLTHGRIHVTYVPLAGLALSGFLFLWIGADHVGGPHLAAWLLAITGGVGIAGGLYSVPLYALMQHRSPADRRGRVVSANNIMNALFMVAGAVGALVVAARFPQPAALLGALALGNLAVSVYMIWLIPEAVLHTGVRFVLRLVFRVRVDGLENYPTTGPRLIIANHTSWLDGALLAAFLPERPVFAVDTRVAGLAWIRPFFKWITALPVDPTHPLAVKALCASVSRGDPVAIFPEGRLSTTGGLMKVYAGPGFIAHRTGAQIVPVHIEGAQLSAFTRLRGKFVSRWFPRITLTIRPARVMPPTLARAERTPFLAALLSESAFYAQPVGHSLYRELQRAANRHGRRRIMWESAEGKRLTYGGILRSSAYLGSRLCRITQPGETVGLMLPTSVGGALAFWGLQFGHRVPAWLNFTMAPGPFVSTAQTARVGRVLTSRAFVTAARLEARIEALAAAGIAVTFLEDLRPSGLGRLGAAWRGLVGAWAHRGHARRWNAAGRDPRAAILFTSGSSGLPKAVVLSHANLLANAAQLRSRIDFTHRDCVFNALPLFHAFGLTGGLLTPLFSGVRTVLYPTPLHFGIIPELIYDRNATISFATNSFLNGYARKAHNYDFHALRYVFAGAEKLQPATQRIWYERFGIRIFEGYGTTEASPALAMNTPLDCKPGTAGRFLPGIDYRLEPVPGAAGGRLHFRGPNRMLGYYRPENPGVLTDAEAWYDTGDIVAVDAQGYVTVLGRAKRFAKIAGEMISLAAVEEVLAGASRGAVAVVARPHAGKGEELVVCTDDIALSPEAVRQAARAGGLSELATPRRVKHCLPFPLLGTGKPDLRRLEELAAA